MTNPQNERSVMLFIAVSLDGYIADSNGDISWLSVVDQPGEDYGYFDFISRVDTVLMGRKTYDKVLEMGIPFPHKDRECYVLSRSRMGQDDNVTYFNGPVEDLVSGIRSKPGKNVFCDGGADTIYQLVDKNLIDTFIISVVPVLLGSGVKLFGEGFRYRELILQKSLLFPSGLIQLWYTKKS